MRIVLKSKQKLNHLEEALPEVPRTTATTSVHNAYTLRVKEQQEIACHMLASMSPEIEKNLEDEEQKPVINLYLAKLIMSGSDADAPPPPPPPPSQTPSQQTPHTVSTIKLYILKKGEYDIWAMKMEHYLAHTDYPIWEVIQRGNGPVSVSTDTNGLIKVLPPKNVEEILAKERERKVRTTLLMALPEDHLAKFHKMTDAKEMWEAIKSRFGGNDESKKMQKYILKQQFEGFSVSNSEGIHKGYDRFQSLLSQLEIHSAGVSIEDANQKFLRVFESDVKGSTASSSSIQNVAFVLENTSSTNDVSTAYGVSNSSGHNTQYENTSSYSLLAYQSSYPQLDHEDLEQLDEFDLEEMDLKWQVAMISMRMKKLYKKTGRKLQFDAKEPVRFDKTKVECYSCHKTGHFARECRSKGNQDGRRRNAWNTGNKEKDNGRRFGKHEDSKALVTLDGEGVDWTSHSEDEQENYAFMACNSSCSDTDVTFVPKNAYTQALKKVEAQLVAHQLGQLWYEENIRFMKIDLDDTTDVLTYHKKLLAEAEKEKEDLKAKVEKWQNSSKNLNILLNSQMSTRDKAGLGYGNQMNKSVLSYENEVFQSVFISRTSETENSHVNDRYVEGLYVVPPPTTGIYIPSGPDKEIDDSQFTYGPKQSKPSESDASQPKVWSDAPIIEEYESDSKDEHVSLPTKEQEIPSLGYRFTTKACFVYGSLSHLIRDYDFHEKRMAKQVELNKQKGKGNVQREDEPVWNNVQSVNHQNHFVPKAVLTRTGKIPVNTARTSSANIVNIARHNFNRQAVPINAVRKVNIVKPIVNNTRPNTGFHKSVSPFRKSFNRTTLRTNFSKQKINTAEVNAISAVKGKRETAVKPSADYLHRAVQNKGIVDSGCSRHMTRNKDFNGDPVAFRGSKGYITGKGKIKTGKLDFKDECFVKDLHHNLFSVSQICDKKNKVLFTDSECLVLSLEFKLPDANQVLLRIPRQNNMYNFNLENLVPSRGLACLITKVTIDESNKWHRRLGHVNFKNLNKLVKGNLVRGLLSKIFQNDHTCVACLKGKQHKASCKAKSVSSISQPLQLLHMHLFGPTSVRSLNHKTYCLVIIDDFSRCDNGIEFKNRDFIEFCGSKGIKREYSNARTPQQNGVAERKNRTLIEAARTMLADSFLPNTFWAEAVSTACYVLNRVLVTKPHNKTPYELVTGKIPIISYIRPFGCHVTILNTIDHLGKFDGKSDEGFLVGSKNQPNKHVGPQEANQNVGTEDNIDAGDSEIEAEYAQDYFVLPIWSSYTSTVKSSKVNNAGEEPTKHHDFKQEFAQETEDLLLQAGAAKASSTNVVNTASTLVSNASPYGGLSFTDLTNTDQDDSEIPTLKEIYDNPTDGIFTNSSYDDEGAVADFTNLEPIVNVSPILTSKINSIHPSTLILRDPQSAQRINNHKDFQHCLFACFLSQNEPKKISEALEDESWVDAMQEELNKKDERGVVVRNKARLVAQGHRLEEGIDYDEVFSLVARIEAIRIFLAFASYMGFIVDQMDVKSAFLYGKIDEEVYVSQPPGFIEPTYPKKVYNIVKALYGLHQDPRAWYATLSTFLLKNGYRRGTIDKTLFIKKDKYDIILVSEGPTQNWALVSYMSTFDLKPYSDSDYAGANLDRKSTTGGCQFLGRRLISWQCKKQTIVATSTTEA
ncbi:putative ribonuclease H-like domain-containing protein [Tanacetum coccineum]